MWACWRTFRCLRLCSLPNLPSLTHQTPIYLLPSCCVWLGWPPIPLPTSHLPGWTPAYFPPPSPYPSLPLPFHTSSHPYLQDTPSLEGPPLPTFSPFRTGLALLVILAIALLPRRCTRSPLPPQHSATTAGGTSGYPTHRARGRTRTRSSPLYSYTPSGVPTAAAMPLPGSAFEHVPRAHYIYAAFWGSACRLVRCVRGSRVAAHHAPSKDAAQLCQQICTHPHLPHTAHTPSTAPPPPCACWAPTYACCTCKLLRHRGGRTPLQDGTPVLPATTALPAFL